MLPSPSERFLNSLRTALIERGCSVSGFGSDLIRCRNSPRNSSGVFAKATSRCKAALLSHSLTTSHVVVNEVPQCGQRPPCRRCPEHRLQAAHRTTSQRCSVLIASSQSEKSWLFWGWPGRRAGAAGAFVSTRFFGSGAAFRVNAPRTGPVLVRAPSESDSGRIKAATATPW